MVDMDFFKAVDNLLSMIWNPGFILLLFKYVIIHVKAHIISLSFMVFIVFVVMVLQPYTYITYM